MNKPCAQCDVQSRLKDKNSHTYWHNQPARDVLLHNIIAVPESVPNVVTVIFYSHSASLKKMICAGLRDYTLIDVNKR